MKTRLLCLAVLAALIVLGLSFCHAKLQDLRSTVHAAEAR